MENKKLVNILLKDMGELEELIAEMKSTRRFDALEVELVHTRAKGILQLMQLLDVKEEPTQEDIREEIENVERLKEEAEKKLFENEDVLPEKQREEETQEEAPMQIVEEVKITEVVEEDSSHKEEPIEKLEEEDEDMLEEETVESGSNSRLGDSFLIGKSVNDLLSGSQKLEFKLSNRRVSSIQAAIGINDRFQYIRELFEGNNEKFQEAVKILDSKQNIKEAVDYLRAHYKWKKNETSLKFINLVKRRFQDE
ncbi:hypothetical protein D1164_17205 [Mariniphaga sediminis]|uniref:Uncharacterized protein n=1 Tax=Mariniphaga sediminis TaxID=1628158 RepID=A0A399CWX5_9BACT|nr:hypothetical protein [Mariniphaga sediminis]RIH63877.1 hypothetical protein D1164_17205 [Mariniphaga sediminis]